MNQFDQANPCSRFYIGLDVGSTTVKAVVANAKSLQICWSDYQRHETRQAEKVLELLEAIHIEFPYQPVSAFDVFITGSGSGPLVEVIGARFVQEVNAVTLAVEKLYPDVNSVIELGGQDAKVILFKQNPETSERHVFTSMNDKCASGTGATIDKCVLKVGALAEQINEIQFDDSKLHHVAAKCGVFAETDIVNLIKAGVPSVEVLNSLADAIVMQNLSVLARGNTLKPKVLLLGGPNTYLPFLQQCWQQRIPELWLERELIMDRSEAEGQILVPKNAQLFAAYGAIIFGISDHSASSEYRGMDALKQFIRHGRKHQLGDKAQPGLIREHEDLQAFIEQYSVPRFTPERYLQGTVIRCYLGVDGGSTSSKAVLLNEQGKVICKAYQLSRGNPILDTRELLQQFKDFAVQQNCTLDILGYGATGYAADVLEKTTRCDVNIVETIAHMNSAKAFCGDDIDVICDIGGQDIKVLFLQNGRIKNFRLSNQCSAGNGMLLQAMADQFGVEVEDFADVAFSAELSAHFSYGCAVFLDTDRVNFQKEGFSKQELFAGLAKVLPKNVWQYVVQIPRMAELGKKFVLQGGTQYNLAAVKAQVDYIHQRVPGAEIRVHPFCGEAGAIGAALEAKRVVQRRGSSTFIGLENVLGLQYSTRTDEQTRCYFCENHCSRTFIDTVTPSGEISRYIAGFSCEKGTVESKDAVKQLNSERHRLKAAYPNLIDYEATLVFRQPYKAERFQPEKKQLKRGWLKHGKKATTDVTGMRKNYRVGIPRVLNNYTLAPFLLTYLQATGIRRSNIVFSDHTSEELWHEGGKFGSIDPCFPAKVSLAHVYQLFNKKHKRRALNAIWFPCVLRIPSFTSLMRDSTTCPIVAGTPKVVQAAFSKEKNWFAERSIQWLDQALDFCDRRMLQQQLMQTWGELLQLSDAENEHACAQAWQAMQATDTELQQRGLQLLTDAEKNNSVVLLLLGRPYHADPGLNHEILDEFQALGYPVLSIRSIPKDPAYLKRFFKRDLELNRIQDVFDITDVWPENYSVNSVQKVWAAKFAARHPNIAVLDLSSFKCGHDAPSYGIIEQIISSSHTPYLAMHDIDANKPGGSIKIRVKTYAYTLQRFHESLQEREAMQTELERRVHLKRVALTQAYLHQHQQKVAQQDSLLWQQMDAEFQSCINKPPVVRPPGDIRKRDREVSVQLDELAEKALLFEQQTKKCKSV
ncbi:MAG: CoA activase [Gammaproteobacteria bacterium]|nr:CoA activase [Gammaproteobacteria bacterium]